MTSSQEVVLLTAPARPEPAPAGPVLVRRSRRPVPRRAVGRGRFRPDVEGLRAVAVLLVVGFHAGVPGLPGGYVGVDVFFVLSGYLITGLLLRELRATGGIRLLDFVARRVRRLLPVSALVLVVTALAALALLPPVDHEGVLADVRAAGLYAANWHFALEQADYTAASGRSPVLHVWSLSVEEQFYVLWPLLLAAVAGAGVGRRWWEGAQRRAALLVAVVGTGSLVLSAVLSEGLGPWAYYGLHTRAWELLAGAALALGLPALPALTARGASLAGWSGLVLVVGSAMALDAGTAFPGTAAGWPVLGTTLLVVAGAGRRAAVGASAALSTAVPRYLGRISYAWYLWHWPCLVLLAGVGRTAEEDAPPAARQVLLAVGVSLVLAVVTHALVEQPVRRSRALAQDRRLTLGLGGLLTLLVVLVTSLPATSGTGVAALVEEVAPTPTPSVPTAGPTLQQSPVLAREDLPEDTDGCHLDFVGTTVEECRFETGAGPTVVLLGDSHATQWFPAARRAARERDWTLYLFTKGLCPANDVPVWSPTLRGPYPACSEWRAEVLRRVAELPDVDAVVIGRRGEYAGNVASPDGDRLPVAEAAAAWTEGTRRTLAALAAAVPRVVLLEPVPVPAGDVPECVSEADGDYAQCAFPRVPATGGSRLLADAEQPALAEHPDLVRRVDLNDQVCPQDPCPVVDPAGLLVYRDGSHLSASVTEGLAAVFADRVEQALR